MTTLSRSFLNCSLVVYLLVLVPCSGWRAVTARLSGTLRPLTMLASPWKHEHAYNRLSATEDRQASELQQTREQLPPLSPEEEAEMILIERVQREVFEETGSELEDLINPSKVISLERELVALSAELDKTSELQARASIEAKMMKKRDVLVIEKRAVMRSWLKNLFVAQSVLALCVSGVLVYEYLS